MGKLFVIMLLLFNHSQQVKCDFLKSIIDKLFAVRDMIVNSITKRISDIFSKSNDAVQKEATSRPKRHEGQSFSNLPIGWKAGNDETSDRLLACSGDAHYFTAPQLSASDGRIIETHVTYTLDGYILTLHRLKPRQTDSQIQKRTILLHHGLLGSSADWILLGQKSLPYILSDAGHDVWLANSRGNYYSRSHVSIKHDSEKFWNFSWQEIGMYDLPATLSYIRATKNSTSPIDYIGHSMGATAFLVLLSVKHSYNSYFRMAILLAPLVLMSNTRGPLLTMASMGSTNLERILGKKEYTPSKIIPKCLWMGICHGFQDHYNNPLLCITGGPLQNGTRSADFINKLYQYVPAGGSIKTIRHYLQLIDSKEFHHFGRSDQKFELKGIDCPILIISSNNDFISNVTDNRMLYLSLAKPIGHIVIEDKKLSHSEFAWGSDADNLLYYKIRDMIEVGPDVNKII